MFVIPESLLDKLHEVRLFEASDDSFWVVVLRYWYTDSLQQTFNWFLEYGSLDIKERLIFCFFVFRWSGTSSLFSLNCFSWYYAFIEGMILFPNGDCCFSDSVCTSACANLYLYLYTTCTHIFGMFTLQICNFIYLICFLISSYVCWPTDLFHLNFIDISSYFITDTAVWGSSKKIRRWYYSDIVVWI